MDSGGTKNYVTDGSSPASAVLQDGAATYTPGLSERRSGVSKFYHGDLLGSTRAITNSSQTTTDTAVFDGFGMVVSRTGTTPTPFGYAGGWQYQADGDSGLMLLGHRYYDASVGRFISRDPIQDGTNWYAYCDNNPLGFVDPEGLDTWVFNGTKLKRYADSGPNRGQLIDMWDAFSGRPGIGAGDASNPGGPIPPGEYYINPDEDEYFTGNPFGRYLGRGYVDNYEGWGDRRIRIHPQPGTNVHGRWGFYLHGGQYVGSIGCIDIGPNDIPIIDMIGKLKGNQKLIVDYTGWKGTVPQNKYGGRISWAEYRKKKRR